MIFEKNEFIEVIENRMNLKFEELELLKQCFLKILQRFLFVL